MWIFLALLVPLLLLPDGAAAEDAPPVVSNATISPSGSLPYTGGNVSVSADVVDDVGVAQVYTVVTAQDGTVQAFEMLPTGPTSFSTSVQIPANYRDETFDYTFVVQAVDTNGVQSEAPAGEIQLDAQPQFDERPAVSDPSVSPRSLPAGGGPVTIEATATDNRSISEVYAVVTLPGGGTATVPLEPISFSRFSGVFNAPASTHATAEQYGVQITALDDIGQSDTIDAGTFSVAGRPPLGGPLTVSPASWSFGSVFVGTKRQHPIVLRNAGGKTTPTVSGVVSTSGAPYFLVGAPAGGIRFSLRPGQSQTYHVEFRPTAVGLKSGSVLIRRDDGGQPGLAVRLSGTGAAKK
jgi:hypothetical protein